MIKKNTLLLTVIAVATLLVAVVGATFAYFSLSASGSASTTATVKTGKVGSLVMTSPNKNLYLNVTATDMAESVSQTAAKDYWATTTEKPGETLESNYNTDETYYKVSTVTLSGADKGTQYHCTAKFTITVTGLESEKEQLQDGDGLLSLKTTKSNGVTIEIGETKDAEEKVETTTHTLKSLANASKDFWVMYDFTSTGESDTVDLEAAFKLTNTQEDQSTYLAGKTITLTIKADETDGKLTCNIVQPGPGA